METSIEHIEVTNRGIIDDEAEKAIAIWEKGVAKEKVGLMNDAIRYYRQALKIHEGVEKIYRKKLQQEWELQKKLSQLNLNELGQSKDTDSVSGETTDHQGSVDVLPCWILEMLPNDLLLKVIKQVVLQSGESWVNLSLTCSTFNKLCFHTTLPFNTFSNYIYPEQHYDESTMTINGISNLKALEEEIWNNDTKQMLKDRPYIKFQGLYISTVNILRHGANVEGSSSFLNPIHMITYYRYFRFYPDGSCLRLLTTDEPTKVVNHFHRELPPKYSESCRWSLGFDDNFGHLTITRSNDKYSFIEELKIKNHSNRRHHIFKWFRSAVIDKEGNVSELSLRNEKTFFFSRVKSYSEKFIPPTYQNNNDTTE
ncbi:hypothetical protein Kpol_543p48 [Vanderwaltozyma polyspora DSM 70294]|uniref:F-box domain-containing protein n=1 Tax=Vanderwaltozyma polyspora (strain ATCC 22028 / DSM 70294 / BCRC 21397 / CBS 2163 / NBRC 10782 / NRRL Y-8283 / UCD 57-17) TaxID=436907 RepID=A7THQ2_VANPO|nr:uncharacterized protein Kpol_543p48 [Vanderwaltozyma polyspora DSM 70294]EDO18218.1 hypothetical protein Kpol_543p48 [Vanderwaltozyma polyspora DSM 70294]